MHAFDAPDRHDRGWVLSVAHVAVVRTYQLDSLKAHSGNDIRFRSGDRPGELVWDHPDIVRRAKHDIRSRYLLRPNPDKLLGNKFTLRELLRVHEDVAGHELPRDKFSRRMEPHLIATGIMNETPEPAAAQQSSSAASPDS